MALTKIPRGLLDTGIADSSDATAITIDSSENVTFAGNILKTGDLTLDVSGDFIFDADGGDIKFLDGGTEWGRIQNGTGSQLILQSKVSDEDMLFQGNDGGSNITALTLDMSDGGSATFNADVSVDRYLKLRTTDDHTNSWLFYTHTDDTLRINYNGAGNDEIVVDTSGKIGIGTASPTELLEVNSTGASTAIEVSAGAASTTTGEAKIVLRSLHSASGTTYSRSEIASLGVAGGDSDLIFRTTTDTNGPQERMRINSSGNVGIGVTSITHALEINRASSSAAYAVVGNGGDVQSYIGVAGDNLPVLGSFTNHDLRLVTNATERMRILSGGQFAVNDTGTSSHQMKLTSSTMGLRIKSGNGGYSSLTWSGDNETTIGSLTTYDGRLYIGAQNSGGTGSNGEIVVKPGTSSSSGGVGTTLGRTPDVSLEIGGPLKIVNNTAGGISQTHTNMSVANSGKLLINFGSIGTMTVGDTIVFEYAATSWKSWFFKIRWSSTGGYMGELWAGGYNNTSDGYQILNPRYYAAASGDGSSQSTVEGATLTVTRSGQENTMTLTLTGTHVHPLFEIEYACGGGEGYPNASKASITVNS